MISQWKDPDWTISEKRSRAAKNTEESGDASALEGGSYGGAVQLNGDGARCVRPPG